MKCKTKLRRGSNLRKTQYKQIIKIKVSHKIKKKKPPGTEEKLTNGPPSTLSTCFDLLYFTHTNAYFSIIRDQTCAICGTCAYVPWYKVDPPGYIFQSF